MLGNKGTCRIQNRRGQTLQVKLHDGCPEVPEKIGFQLISDIEEHVHATMQTNRAVQPNPTGRGTNIPRVKRRRVAAAHSVALHLFCGQESRPQGMGGFVEALVKREFALLLRSWHLFEVAKNPTLQCTQSFCQARSAGRGCSLLWQAGSRPLHSSPQPRIGREGGSSKC